MSGFFIQLFFFRLNEDICYAQTGWHSHSFELEFDGLAGDGVGVRSALRVRGADCSAVECWFMGIQPTERGKQIKRPKGDLL